ncbi:MAG: hypothetical protein VYD50_04365 [Candidatus Thermoplasmatota archaeon]|nr:hypothetical protein [Candidatus Thermoplasmatota archaeon]
MVVNRVFLLVFVLLSPFYSGCIEVPTVRPCPDNACFPLTSDSFNELFTQEGAFDVLALASEHEQIRVRSTLIQEHQGERGEIYWDVAKDDDAGLRYVSTRYVVSGLPLIDSEVIDGKGITNIRSGSDWHQGRDASPHYVDPFFELAQRAAADPGGMWPPFGFDTSQLAGLSWTITGDAFSSQQVASASNDTHDFIIELTGLSPQIIAIEVYSGDDYEFILRVTTEDIVIELKDSLPRAQIPFVPQPPNLLGTYGDTTILVGSIPEALAHEANLSEIEIHATVGGETAASMRLGDGDSNISTTDGTWWNLMWMDAGQQGLFSSLDTYYVRTNSTAEFDVRFYDLWADAWTDQPF